MRHVYRVNQHARNGDGERASILSRVPMKIMWGVENGVGLARDDVISRSRTADSSDGKWAVIGQCY